MHALETQMQNPTKKRGRAKYDPLHIGLLLVSTLLLILAAIFLVMQYNFLGIITMIVGMAVRYFDTRL